MYENVNIQIKFYLNCQLVAQIKNTLRFEFAVGGLDFVHILF